MATTCTRTINHHILLLLIVSRQKSCCDVQKGVIHKGVPLEQLHSRCKDKNSSVIALHHRNSPHPKLLCFILGVILLPQHCIKQSKRWSEKVVRRLGTGQSLQGRPSLSIWTGACGWWKTVKRKDKEGDCLEVWPFQSYFTKRTVEQRATPRMFMWNV